MNLIGELSLPFLALSIVVLVAWAILSERRQDRQEREAKAREAAARTPRRR